MLPINFAVATIIAIVHTTIVPKTINYIATTNSYLDLIYLYYIVSVLMD